MKPLIFHTSPGFRSSILSYSSKYSFSRRVFGYADFKIMWISFFSLSDHSSSNQPLSFLPQWNTFSCICLPCFFLLLLDAWSQSIIVVMAHLIIVYFNIYCHGFGAGSLLFPCLGFCFILVCLPSFVCMTHSYDDVHVHIVGRRY